MTYCYSATQDIFYTMSAVIIPIIITSSTQESTDAYEKSEDMAWSPTAYDPQYYIALPQQLQKLLSHIICSSQLLWQKLVDL